MSKAGTSLRRQTESLDTTRGIDTRFPRDASGPVRRTPNTGAAYNAKVRIAVRAGAVTVTREGCGTGQGKAFTPGQAHELALKAAETDATKRALATFGNPFGLALYDRELAGVTNRKALMRKSDEYRGPWLLSLPSSTDQSFDRSDEFIAALSKALADADDIEQLFSIWERNVDVVRAINKHINRSTPRGVIVQNLVAHLRTRAIALAKQGNQASEMKPQTSVIFAQRWTRAFLPFQS